MPKSQAFNECIQPFRTVLVDEFRRTMVRAGDGLAMTQLWSRRKQAAVRGLMWRNSTIRKFFKHNLNAALNLGRCLALTVRPKVLCRVVAHGES